MPETSLHHWWGQYFLPDLKKPVVLLHGSPLPLQVRKEHVLVHHIAIVHLLTALASQHWAGEQAGQGVQVGTAV